MVIKGQRYLGAVGEVRGDVVGGQLDLAVLHVFGMDEQDLLEDAQLFQQSSTDETVEVAAGDETVRAVEGERGTVGHTDSIGRLADSLEAFDARRSEIARTFSCSSRR